MINKYLFLFSVSLIGSSFAASVHGNNVTDPVSYGSVLFKHGIGLICFTEYQKSLLAARMEVEKMFPKFEGEPPNNDNGFDMLLKYFHKISRNIERMSHVRNKNVALSAFYDILGGYLKSNLIPNAKISFYAGNTSLHTVREILDIYEKCKTSLDTKGLGWTKPFQNITSSNVYAIPLYLNLVESDCSDLLILDEEEGESEDEIIALPRLEYDDNSKGLTNIWLPFRRKHVYNLRSKLSAFIFMRYFIAASKCYETERVPPKDFNQRLERWIQINVVPHLKDEKLYAGFGGVLRVLRTLKDMLNDTGPLIPMTRVQNLRRHSGYSALSREQEEYEFKIVGGQKDDNMTTTMILKSVSTDPLLTKNMAWITVFTIIGVLLIVLVFVCMKRCVSNKQRDMRNIPLADPPSFHDTSKSMLARSRSGRSSKSYLARKQLPVTSSTSSMASRPKDYINPRATTVSYAVEEKKQSRRNTFLTPFNMIPSKTSGGKTKDGKPSSFKVTSDSESEEEIFDLKNFIEKKDLTTDDIPPHTSKNETNLLKLAHKGQSINKSSKVKDTQEKPSKHETKPLKPPKINVKGTVDVKMFRGVRDDNNVLMKNSKLSRHVIKRTRSKSVDTSKRNNDPTIIHKRYNLESSAWETVHD